jgi:hypothetical protein
VVSLRSFIGYVIRIACSEKLIAVPLKQINVDVCLNHMSVHCRGLNITLLKVDIAFPNINSSRTLIYFNLLDKFAIVLRAAIFCCN